jgi:long-chain acyl-CoA synthetase
VALIVPDAEAAKAYARANRCPAALDQLVEDPGFQRTIGEAVDRANESLSVIERVRHFHLLPQPFTIENGTMTPTLKLKRQLIYRVHEDLFESLYQGYR